MPERDPWTWEPGEHYHARDTNGDRYRCPVADCWWNVQRLEEQANG
jgi:hypothetical protein